MSLSYNLNQKLNEEIINTLDNLLTGHYPLYLVESGVSVFINQNRAKSTKPKNRSYISQSPTATILVKKKAFSTFSATLHPGVLESLQPLI